MQEFDRALLHSIKRKQIDLLLELDIEVNGLPVKSAVMFHLQEMSGTERDRFEIATFKLKPQTNGATVTAREVDPLYLRSRLVVSCLVTATGERQFKDDQVKELSDAFPASTVAALFAAAQKLNGLEAEAVEDAAKNSASDLEGASTSSLPENSAKPSLNS